MIGVIIAMRELVNQLKATGKVYSQSMGQFRAIRAPADDFSSNITKGFKDLNTVLMATSLTFSNLNHKIKNIISGTGGAGKKSSVAKNIQTKAQEYADALGGGLSYSQYISKTTAAVGKNRHKELEKLIGQPVDSIIYNRMKNLSMPAKRPFFDYAGWAAPPAAVPLSQLSPLAPGGPTPLSQIVFGQPTFKESMASFGRGFKNMGANMLMNPMPFVRNVLSLGYRADKGIFNLMKKGFRVAESIAQGWREKRLDPDREVYDYTSKTNRPLKDFLYHKPGLAKFYNKLAQPAEKGDSPFSLKGGLLMKPFNLIRQGWNGLKTLGPPLGNILKSVGKFAAAGAGIGIAMAALQILSVVNPFRDIFEIMMDNFAAWGDIFNASMAPLMIAIEQLFDSPEFMAIVFQLGNLFSVLAVAMVPLVQPLGMIIKFAIQIIGLLVPIVVLLMPVLVLLLNAFLIPMQLVTDIIKMLMPFLMLFAMIIGIIAQVFVWLLPVIAPIIMFLAGIIVKLMTAVANVMVSIWNFIIGLINRAMDAFGVDPSKRLPLLPTGFMEMNMSMPTISTPAPVSFSTPMAAGGIVTRPTFALIGESGPEAVVPLNKGYGDGITINVNATDRDVLTQMEMALWRRDIRKRNSVFA